MMPKNLVTDRSQLKKVFFTESERLGYTSERADALFQILPTRVQDTLVEKYVIGEEDDWRYVYGEGFKIGKDSFGIGIPHQRPLVRSLIIACDVAKKYLSVSQLNTWKTQVDRPAKHYDAISEMVVIANAEPDSSISYEKRGIASGSKLIDWLVESEDKKYLLEVKNRPGQMARNLEVRKGNTKSPYPYEPVINFDELFKSVEDKFHPVSTSGYIQGAALFLSLIVPRASLEKYFQNRLKNKLHYVALVREDGRHVNLIAISDEIKADVLSTFGWVDDADLLSDD